MFLVAAAATVSRTEAKIEAASDSQGGGSKNAAVLHVTLTPSTKTQTQESTEEDSWSYSSCTDVVSRSCPWLESVPFIDASCEPSRLEALADGIAARYSGEFCWAASFEPGFVASLMSHGFLTMAQRVGNSKDTFALLPKMHRHRCVLRFEDRHTPKSIRRKSRQLRVSRDRDFEAVVRGIAEQHGEECWLYPPLVDAFRSVFDNPGGVVRVHTFECWRGDDLVAGELGYACGDIYTSLSGFSNFASAGSVQCAATANWLRISGYILWDLGMELPYKLAMGATNVPRAQFYALVKRARTLQPIEILGGNRLINARDVLDADISDDSSSFLSEVGSTTQHSAEMEGDEEVVGVED